MRATIIDSRIGILPTGDIRQENFTRRRVRAKIYPADQQNMSHSPEALRIKLEDMRDTA